MTTPTEHLLLVVMNGKVIGDVQRTGRRRMRLRYADDQLDGGITPLSVSMPEGRSRHRETVLEPWLSGLLPDRPETLRQWRRQFGLTDDSVFALLRHVGEDVAGAAQFVRPERLDRVLTSAGGAETLSQLQIAQMLRRARADLPASETPDGQGKFSLAGAQAKIALHRGGGGWSDPSGSVPSTHIIKPAIPGMADQDLIEAVTLRTATNLGLRTARCWIEEFADERAVVVARFDRTQSSTSWWTRVHQEDMCQAMALWPIRKYESQGGPSASAVARLIRQHSQRPAEDLTRFAQALIFNWLVMGTDAHARNYSLLLSSSAVRLAPLYDLNSHLAYTDGSGVSLSMAVGGTFRADRISSDDWVRFAPALHVAPDWLGDEIQRQRDGLLVAMTSAAATRDVDQYDSPTVARLLSNTDARLSRRSG